MVYISSGLYVDCEASVLHVPVEYVPAAVRSVTERCLKNTSAGRINGRSLGQFFTSIPTIYDSRDVDVDQ